MVQTAGEWMVQLLAERDEARQALEMLLSRYVALANSGDCGSWDVEAEAEVIAARKALLSRQHEAPDPAS